MNKPFGMTVRASILAGLMLGSAAPALALPADFKAKADAYLKSAWPGDGPGGAVIVTEGGKTVYAGGQGLADLEAKTPITPRTVFRLGSITKQFSSAVMMQLVDEGKVSLDDPLSKYLPDYPRPGADATIRQLLNHTSGVQSYTGIPGWMVEENTNRAYTTDELIKVFKDLPAPSKPGEAWAYNNSGYVLVGAVIEKVTGKPWHEEVRERITGPLGLKTIRYGAGEAGFANMAKGYMSGEEGTGPARKIHMSVPHAAGALVGTVEDLAKWGQALHHGKVVSSRSYAAMIAPTPMPGDKPVPYGFGLSREEVRGRKGIGHGGGIFGFSTDSIYLPKEDIFVAVFTNDSDPVTGPGVALQRIAALALGDPYPEFKVVEADPAVLEPQFGVYKVEGEGQRRFYARDGQLYTQRSGGSESKVFAAGNDRYFYGPSSLNWFEITRDAAGAYVMEMHANGALTADKATRIGPIPPEPKVVDVPRSVLERYAGSYQARMGKATVALGEADGLTIQLGGQRPTRLKPVSATEFHVEGVDARIVFQVEGDKASGLVIHQGGREIAASRTAE